MLIETERGDQCRISEAVIVNGELSIFGLLGMIILFFVTKIQIDNIILVKCK